MTLAAFAAFAMTSCKSSKKLAMDAQTEVVDPTALTEVTPATTTYTTPVRTTTPTTTTPARTNNGAETYTAVNSADQAKINNNYNVVVGAFGSKANASAYQSKMAGRGYSAFLIQNAAGLYRVIAFSSPSYDEANNAKNTLRAKYATDDPGTCPAAWILKPQK